MKASIISLTLLLFAGFLAVGCVSHSFLIDLHKDGILRYTVEGDSVDILDGLTRFPNETLWTQVERKSGKFATGDPAITLIYEADRQEHITHPLAPSGVAGTMSIRDFGTPIYRTWRYEIVFPSWETAERYGDPSRYMPVDLMRALEDPLFDSLHPGKREELQQKQWEAEILAARDRYMNMLETLVRDRLSEQGKMFDDETFVEFTKSYYRRVRELMQTAGTAGLEEGNLDWYDPLRLLMVEAGMAITGVPTAELLPRADSLEHRYKRWLDLSDESVNLALVMPGRIYMLTTPDTLIGDTLQWELPCEMLGDSTVVIQVGSWEPRWGGLILLILVLQAIVSVLLHRRYSMSRDEHTL